jgi:alpha-mannosidase
MFGLNRRQFVQLTSTSLLSEALLGSKLLALSPQATEAASPFSAAIARLDAMTGQPVTDWRWHPDTLPHPEDPALNDSDWPAFQLPPGSNSSRDLANASVGDGAVWFRTRIEVPGTLGGYLTEGLPVKLNLRINSRGRGPIRVYSNAGLVEMTPTSTAVPIPLMGQAKPGRQFVIAVFSPDPAAVMGRLEVSYPPGESNPENMRDEILCVRAASAGFPEGQTEREAQLRAAVEAIDFGALDHGNKKGFDDSLAAADAKMRPLAEWIKQFTIRAVGNSHIDLAWLWPWEETLEVVRDTFSTAMDLMDEYPGCFYAQSSAQDFLWLERYYPREFERIRQFVKQGRWELVGGMWCEPDLNMPCGESLVRQLLTGKRYFQEKFGVDVRIGWNPDSFGYSWQLPQIYKRSGVDYFVTQKLSADDTTQVPHKLFQWESPDGSRVLAYFPHGYGNHISPVQGATFIADDTPLCSGFKEQMVLYGVGDHGGGPTREMLDVAERWLKSPQAAFPNFKFSRAQEFFDDVDARLAKLNLPVWKDELYFQFHRGTYTTQAESKRRMRRSEELLLNTEKFCSLAMLSGRPYPQQKLQDCWRRVCFDQFHDVMAGSGIHVNYHDEAESMEFVAGTLTPELNESISHLAANIDTRGPGTPVVVFNPLSWERTDIVEVDVPFPGSVDKMEIRDPDGRILASATVGGRESPHRGRMRFLARAVPAMGYKVFHAVSTEHPRAAATPLKVDGWTLENEFLSVSIDPKTGCINRLVNKKDGRNILKAGAWGNLLETFVDHPPNLDAWNIGWPYQQTKQELLEADEVKLIENTPVRAVVRVKKHFQGSSFVQDICLYPEMSRADVHMHVDWHEQHIMLKVAFPLAISPAKASYEIPYGNIERPAIPQVPGKPPVPFTEATEIKKRLRKYDPLLAQEAEFEVCAQRWGDLSEDGHGFSLLNNCKYGYDTVEEGTLRLTLLRSPVSPRPSKDPNDLYADQGPHDFTYSLYPHAGGWREAGTQRRGYELNYPLMPYVMNAHEGTLPASHSLVTIEPTNVILTAVKKTEDDNSLIFRFFEFEGKDTSVRLTPPEAAVSATVTNLMEKEEHPLTLASGGREISTSIGHYEVKSVKVKFSNVAGPAPPRRV